jgi:hypothetical protein
MPDPQRLLNTLRKAVAASRATPGRVGRVVHLPAGSEVMVVGDLHGNITNFKLLLQQARLDSFPRRHIVFQELIHGTAFYPGGGDKSHQVLDVLAALKCQYPERVHFLLGNHELAQWHDQQITKSELACNNLFRAGVEEAYADYADEVYDLYLQMFAAACVALRTPNRVFISHSLPSARHLPSFDPAVLERDDFTAADVKLGGTMHALLWDRDASQANVEAFLSRVDADWLITGHLACDNGFDQPNSRQLVLDAKTTPAGYCIVPTEGPLTSADLANAARFV